MPFDPDKYLGVEEEEEKTGFDPDAYLGIKKKDESSLVSEGPQEVSRPTGEIIQPKGTVKGRGVQNLQQRIEPPKVVVKNEEYETSPYKDAMLSKMKNDNEKKSFLNIESEYEKRGGMSPYKKLFEYQNLVSSGMDPYQALMNVGLDYNPQEGSISLPENEQELFNSLQRSELRRRAEEKAKKEKTPFGKSFYDSMAAAANDAIGGTYDVLSIFDPTGTMKYTANKMYKDAERLRENIKGRDTGITESVQEGNYADAAAKAAIGIGESIPVLTALALGNKAGATETMLGWVGTTTAKKRHTELKDEDMSEFNKVVNAIGYGIAEMAFENAGTVSILKNVNKSIKNIGKESAQKQLQDIYATRMEKVLSSIYGGTTPIIKEGSSEWATTVSQNLIDVATNNGDISEVFKGGADAFIIGALIGKGLSIPVDVANAKNYISKKTKELPSSFPEDNKIKATELLIEKDKLKKEEQLDEPFKKDHTKKIEKINNELRELNKKPTEETSVKVDEEPNLEKIEPKTATGVTSQRINPEEVQLTEKFVTPKPMQKILKMQGENNFTRDVVIDNKKAGEVHVEETPDTWNVKWIEVGSPFQGRGVSSEMYRQLNQQANEEGKVIQSDRADKMFPATKRTWNNIVERGEAKKTDDGRYRMVESVDLDTRNKIFSRLGMGKNAGNLIESGEITYTNEKGEICAKHGIRNQFRYGGKWNIIKSFKGKSHADGGIDVDISNGGIKVSRGDSFLKAENGCLIRFEE